MWNQSLSATISAVPAQELEYECGVPTRLPKVGIGAMQGPYYTVAALAPGESRERGAGIVDFTGRLVIEVFQFESVTCRSLAWMYGPLMRCSF